MKVYIAGPMSGVQQFNIPAFDEAAATLRRYGLEVISPAELDGSETRAALLRSATGSHADIPHLETYDGYLDRDLEIIATEDLVAIITLPGWRRSPGANREVGFALGRGIRSVEYDPADPLTAYFAVVELCSAAVARAASVCEELYEDGVFISYDSNPDRQRSVTGGVKDNRGKAQVELIPSEPLFAVGRVLGFGARKYKPNNWRLGLSWLQTFGSAQRHMLHWLLGEDRDSETGESHIDHAICQLMFLSTYEKTGAGTDDRWTSQSDHEDAKA